jgi:acyl carrier protein
MELKDFFEDFASQFDDTDITEFKFDTKFRELDEWSSLIALCLLSMFKENYGVRLKPEEMRKAETVGELFNIIKEKSNV